MRSQYTNTARRGFVTVAAAGVALRGPVTMDFMTAQELARAAAVEASPHTRHQIEIGH